MDIGEITIALGKYSWTWTGWPAAGIAAICVMYFLALAWTIGLSPWRYSVSIVVATAAIQGVLLAILSIYEKSL